jgi:hypothetical protein
MRGARPEEPRIIAEKGGAGFLGWRYIPGRSGRRWRYSGTLRATLARAHLHREELRISEYGDNQEIFQSKLELASPA